MKTQGWQGHSHGTTLQISRRPACCCWFIAKVSSCKESLYLLTKLLADTLAGLGKAKQLAFSLVTLVQQLSCKSIPNWHKYRLSNFPRRYARLEPFALVRRLEVANVMKLCFQCTSIPRVQARPGTQKSCWLRLGRCAGLNLVFPGLKEHGQVEQVKQKVPASKFRAVSVSAASC